MPIRLHLRFLVCLLCTSGVPGFVWTQSTDISFQHLTVEQGLCSNYATCITQDRIGFIWIGTILGLTRYDGNKCTVYKNERNDSSSLSNILIRSIFNTKNGQLWVGTQNGLNLFNSESHHFKRFYFDQHGSNCNFIRCINEDDQGNLWLGTPGGLIVFSPTTKQSRRLVLPNDNALSGSFVSIRCLLMDGNIVWIGTERGIFKYNRLSGSFDISQTNNRSETVSRGFISSLLKNPKTNEILVGTRTGELLAYHPFADSVRKLSLTIPEGTEISSLIIDRNKVLWIGTMGAGMFRYDEGRQRFIGYQNDINDLYSLKANSVKAIFEDKSGVIWATGTYGGVSRFNPSAKLFTPPLKEANYRPYSSDGHVIARISMDQNDNLWLASRDGLVFLNQQENTYRIYRNQPGNPNTLSENSLHCVLADRTGKVWAGTPEYLNCLDPATGNFTRFKYLPHRDSPSELPAFNPKKRDFVAGKNVYDIIQHPDGRIFIGTEQGLTIFDSKTKTFANRFNDERIRRLPLLHYNCLYFDRKGNLWVCCSVEGILKIKADLSEATSYQYHDNDPNSLPYNGTMSFAEDAQGNMWVGTDNGLGYLNTNTQKFTNYSMRDGLSNSYSSALIRDGENLWIGTANGINLYEGKRKVFKSFDRADNLQVMETETKSAAMDKKGNLYFGGYYGLVRFNPKLVTSSSYQPPVLVTSLRVHGQEMVNSLIPEEGKTIILSHNQNDLTIRAAALSYDFPENNLYSFRLGGEESSWSQPTAQPVLNYLNVPPGEYVLYVKAANKDGVWNPTPYRLPIVIRPPFWLTWWFRALLTLAIMGIGFYFYRLRVKMIEHEHATEVKLLEEQRTLQKQLNKELTEKLDYQQKFEKAQTQQAETERKTILLEREKLLSRYQNLVNQLNPHFLFNSLAVLDSLIYKDHKLASKYLRQLTKVYRYLIENDDHETVTLEQELRFAKDFVSLLHMRYNDGLCIEIHLDERLNAKKVVPVTFQNLIENAIKHNITALESPLCILIREENNYLVFKNNLQKRGTVTTSNKKGLNDFRALYSYLTNRPIKIVETETHFTVYVPLMD